MLGGCGENEISKHSSFSWLYEIEATDFKTMPSLAGVAQWLNTDI